MSRTRTRIRWRKPSRRAIKFGAQPETLEQLTPEERAIRRTVLRVGVPVVEGAASARESVVELLKLAAEIEHALMAQYLYAAYSLPDQPGPGTENYHEKLKRIAVQEMCHLVTVQNLLLLVGGPDEFYLQRDLLREESDQNPLQFVLERVSKVSLAKYVATEMPAEVPAELKAKVDELVALAEAEVGDDIHRVGVIYLMLKWMFMKPDEAAAWLDLSKLMNSPQDAHLADADFLPSEEIAPFQAQREEWSVSEEDLYLDTPQNREQAVEAIDRIARQGEGPLGDADSHFNEFIETVDALGELSPVALAKSPTLGGGHGAEGGVEITHPYTALWGQAFAMQYGSLVLSIYFALGTRRREDGEPGLREEVAALAIRAMRRVIGPLSELIGHLRLRDDGSEDLAGPPYDLDPAILAPAAADALVARQLEMLDRQEALYQKIEGSGQATPQHSSMLAALRNLDARRRAALTPDV